MSFSMEVAMNIRRRYLLGVLSLSVCGMVITQAFAQVTNAVPPSEIRVTLLGTASGPRAVAVIRCNLHQVARDDRDMSLQLGVVSVERERMCHARRRS
jgi:hypothetical protein